MTRDDTGPPDAAGSHSAKDIERLHTRQHLQRLRQQMDPATLASHSCAIAAKLAPVVGKAQRIGAYLAFGQEVSVDELMRQCRANAQTTYVPLIQADHTLVFAPLTDSTPIVQNKYAIREPVVVKNTCLPATSLDIVIVPMLGFDPLCNRMGMGGGYYDRTFAFKRQAECENSANPPPLLIGVAFESQCVDHLSTDWWDVPLDHVVTETAIYSRTEAITPIG